MVAMGNNGAGGMPKFKEYVFSTTLDKVQNGATLIKGDTKTEIEKIKKQKGKDIWLFGGAGLTTSLLNLGLVDEISLAVHPIILGAGKPLFHNIQNKLPLRLLDSKAYSTGLVALTYTIGQK
jgi:dihydrofolate reductase